MRVPTNQSEKTIDLETWASRDIKPAKVKPITRGRFEGRFCAVLIALIFATIVMVSVFLTHSSGSLVERLYGHVAIDSAKGAGEEKSPFLNRISAHPKTKERNQMMKFEDRQSTINGADPQTKGEWLQTRPGEHCLIRVSAKDTQGLYSLVEVVSDPGDGTPMHIHEREDEHIAVLEGTARVAYGDKVFDIHAGDVVTLRKGIPHAWGNRSSAPLRMAVLASPGGVEEILRLIAKTSPADIPALAERFHVRNIGPAPF